MRLGKNFKSIVITSITFFALLISIVAIIFDKYRMLIGISFVLLGGIIFYNNAIRKKGVSNRDIFIEIIISIIIIISGILEICKYI